MLAIPYHSIHTIGVHHSPTTEGVSLMNSTTKDVTLRLVEKIVFCAIEELNAHNSTGEYGEEVPFEDISDANALGEEMKKMAMMIINHPSLKDDATINVEVTKENETLIVSFRRLDA